MSDSTPEKGGGGRRRKRRRVRERRPKGEQRSKLVGVRLSLAELGDLRAQAKALHTKMATILRAAWLDKPLAVPLPEVLGPAASPPRVLTLAELADYRQLVEAATRLKRFENLLEPGGQLHVEAQALFVQMRQLLAELVPPRTEKK